MAGIEFSLQTYGVGMLRIRWCFNF